MSNSDIRRIFEKEFKNLYNTNWSLEAKLSIVNEKASLKYLLLNPIEDDYCFIKDRIDSLPRELEELKKSYVNYLMSNNRSLRFPHRFEVVNGKDALSCDDAVAIQVFNGSKFRLPTFIYFFKQCEKDSHFADNLEFILAEKYPAFKKALDAELEQKKYGIKGDYLKNAVLTGVFPIFEASKFTKHLDECFRKGYKPLGAIPPYCISFYEEPGDYAEFGL